MRTSISSIIWSTPTKPIQANSTKKKKKKPNPYPNIIYIKSQQQLKNKENKGNNHEILRENKKTYTFFLKIEEEMMKKNGGFWEKHGEFERDMNGQDNEQ